MNNPGARTWLWWAIGTLAMGWVYVYHRPIFDTLAAMVGQPVIGALVGLGLDKSIYHYARPSANNPRSLWMLRRAVIVGSMSMAFASLR